MYLPMFLRFWNCSVVEFVSHFTCRNKNKQIRNNEETTRTCKVYHMSLNGQVVDYTCTASVCKRLVLLIHPLSECVVFLTIFFQQFVLFNLVSEQVFSRQSLCIVVLCVRLPDVCYQWSRNCYYSSGASELPPVFSGFCTRSLVLCV